MKIGQEFKGCRYWGFEPASREFIHSWDHRHERPKLLKQSQEEKTRIKKFGFKPIEYGFATKESAEAHARNIELTTGVTMRIFNHDYL